MWWKKNKWKVIVPVLIAAILAGAFWYGGSAPGMQGWTVENSAAGTAEPAQTPDTASPPDSAAELAQEALPPGETETPSDAPAEGAESRPGGTDGDTAVREKTGADAETSGGVSPGDEEYSESQGMVIDPATGKDQYLTDPVPEGKPAPVEPQDVTVSDAAHTCTLSISCATILDHMDRLDPAKAALVPEDGWILPPTQVTFYEGESVFNVLQRTCKQQGIHMEFENTPVYNSAYIEGIHNLYEFDCGELSGWMYKVNGWFPNYGCSRCRLQQGDTVEWVYTCDLGADVGGYNSLGG